MEDPSAPGTLCGHLPAPHEPSSDGWVPSSCGLRPCPACGLQSQVPLAYPLCDLWHFRFLFCKTGITSAVKDLSRLWGQRDWECAKAPSMTLGSQWQPRTWYRTSQTVVQLVPQKGCPELPAQRLARHPAEEMGPGEHQSQPWEPRRIPKHPHLRGPAESWRMRGGVTVGQEGRASTGDPAQICMAEAHQRDVGLVSRA